MKSRYYLIIIIICFIVAEVAFAKLANAYDLCVPVGDVNLIQTRDYIAAGGNYQTEIEDPENSGQMIPNPQAKLPFIKSRMRESLIGDYRRGKKILEDQAAIDAIKDASTTEAETEILVPE